jgi:hypothetical protein
MGLTNIVIFEITVHHDNSIGTNKNKNNFLKTKKLIA